MSRSDLQPLFGKVIREVLEITAKGDASYDRDKALAGIAEVLAKGKSFELAHQTAAKISDDYYRATAQIAIARISQKVEDFEQAYQAAAQIKDAYAKVAVLTAIANALVEVIK